MIRARIGLEAALCALLDQKEFGGALLGGLANGNQSGAGAPGDGPALLLEGPGQLAALLFKILEEGLRLEFESRQPRGGHFSQAFLVVGSPRLGTDFHLATDHLPSSQSFFGR